MLIYPPAECPSSFDSYTRAVAAAVVEHVRYVSAAALRDVSLQVLSDVSRAAAGDD
ncbi:MAG: hypothetical protein ABSG43_00265 [Solirubrobacteraceae bacterium]